ncbi:hypothetical protein E3Q24_02722 [Wallemia mellicola]|nr:hypothetical protein E3Q24_02722 [Wallemia mellicola]
MSTPNSRQKRKNYPPIPTPNRAREPPTPSRRTPRGTRILPPQRTQQTPNAGATTSTRPKPERETPRSLLRQLTKAPGVPRPSPPVTVEQPEVRTPSSNRESSSHNANVLSKSTRSGERENRHVTPQGRTPTSSSKEVPPTVRRSSAFRGVSKPDMPPPPTPQNETSLHNSVQDTPGSIVTLDSPMSVSEYWKQHRPVSRSPSYFSNFDETENPEIARRERAPNDARFSVGARSSFGFALGDETNQFDHGESELIHDQSLQFDNESLRRQSTHANSFLDTSNRDERTIGDIGNDSTSFRQPNVILPDVDEDNEREIEEEVLRDDRKSHTPSRGTPRSGSGSSLRDTESPQTRKESPGTHSERQPSESLDSANDSVSSNRSKRKRDSSDSVANSYESDRGRGSQDRSPITNNDDDQEVDNGLADADVEEDLINMLPDNEMIDTEVQEGDNDEGAWEKDEAMSEGQKEPDDWDIPETEKPTAEEEEEEEDPRQEQEKEEEDPEQEQEEQEVEEEIIERQPEDAPEQEEGEEEEAIDPNLREQGRHSNSPGDPRKSGDVGPDDSGDGNEPLRKRPKPAPKKERFARGSSQPLPNISAASMKRFMERFMNQHRTGGKIVVDPGAQEVMMDNCYNYLELLCNQTETRARQNGRNNELRASDMIEVLRDQGVISDRAPLQTLARRLLPAELINEYDQISGDWGVDVGIMKGKTSNKQPKSALKRPAGTEVDEDSEGEAEEAEEDEEAE